MSQGGYPGGLGGDLGGEGGTGGVSQNTSFPGGGGEGGLFTTLPGGGGGSQFTPFPGEGGRGGYRGGTQKFPNLPLRRGGFPGTQGGGTLSLICLIRTFQKKGSR